MTRSWHSQCNMALPAEPILASALWNPQSAESTPPKQRLPTSCRAIDTALNGGLDYGSITCITAEADAGAREITQALLVSHLCCTKDTNATVIDTGQAVDVRRLYRAILTERATSGESASKAEAKAAMDRVNLIKTFDFEGLTEGVSELRDVLEGRVTSDRRPPRGTIADSQEDEDEMLDSPAPPSRKPTTAAMPGSVPKTTGSSGLLIIDNITQLAAPLLKANHASGQALITSFMRSLGHLTRTYSLCTIIMNSTLSNSSRKVNFKEDSPSAFSSCTARPALGKTWTYLVDMHLLLHGMPKTGKDASAVYGGQKVDGPAEMVNVIEVLHDRCEGRVGRWTAFHVGDDGRPNGIA